jgi:tRNA1(Val) A37 N6-methylase TrmN6
MAGRGEGTGIKDAAVVERIGPYMLRQAGHGLRITQDPFLLVDFALPLSENERVLDIGTGSGVIPLLLIAKTRVLDVTAVEIDDALAGLARANVQDNSLGDRIKVVASDYRGLPEIFPKGSFTTIITNPPYIKANSGRTSPQKSRALARLELHGELKDLVQVSAHLLCDAGRLFLILPTARREELVELLRGVGLSLRRIRFIHTKFGAPAKLFMAEAIKGTADTAQVVAEEPVYLSKP